MPTGESSEHPEEQRRKRNRREVQPITFITYDLETQQLSLLPKHNNRRFQ